MQRRIETQVETSGKLPERLDALFRAQVEIDPQRRAAFLRERVDILRVKIRASGQTEEFAPQHADLGIEGDDRLVAVYLDDVLHGSTPWLSSHFLIEETAPLSVSGDGCGR